ncbi:SDR family oxidoreductase [Salinimonas iocasae]|uniref:SDR family oxidoreductase n=1 Tax=Salinimonas iocasae TaxID=2572577 RepID=A0A5B7YE53_9ALTE|nr:SDR family oxidoreductase [Salinimonas iocasae]QCZ93871.1 SDR family oxidoreductase [Salinimonas iocasae]
MKSIIITGASSGLGESISIKFAREGWLVFAGVRNEDDAKSLTEKEPKIQPVFLDVSKPEQIKAAVDLVTEKLAGQTVGGLVNNAGIAKLGPLALQDIDEFIQHFEVNAFGGLRMAQAFLPLLGTDESLNGDPGRIINITSVGGELPSPFLGAYTASKHAMESITDSLRRELMVYGIDSISIGPGSVKTPIWKKAKEANAAEQYKDSAWKDSLKTFLDVMIEGGEDGLETEDIADVVYEAMTADKPKARYAPVPNKLINYTLPTMLPERLVDQIFAKKFDIKEDG